MKGRYDYIFKLRKDMQERQKGVSHTIFIGTAGSGKNFTSYNFLEEGIYNGWIKLWNLWIPDFQHLQEAMTFMFPSKSHLNAFSNSKLKPAKFPVRIYIPISQNMPRYLPQGLCVPFTVSMDELTDDCIKILCANKSMDYAGYLSEFRSLVRKGMTLPDLKTAMLEARSGKLLKELGFNDEHWTQSHKSSHGLQEYLMGRLKVLDKEGVIANRKFPYALENFLKREIFDKNTIVILYLGAIRNESLRNFIYLYFLETLRKSLERYGGDKLNFKNVIFHNELETLCKPTSGKDSTPVDMVVNDYLKRMASVGRHINLEVWGDCKSTDFVDDSILTIFKNEYFLRVDNRKEIRRLGDRADSFGDKELHRYIIHIRRMNAYRFIDLHSEMPRWFRGDFIQLGHELIRPRICMDGKVDMKYNNFSYLNGIPAYKIIGWDTDLKLESRGLKKQLADLWRKSDEKLEQFMKQSQSEKPKETPEFKQEKKIDKILNALQKFKDLKNLNDGKGRKTTRTDMRLFAGIKAQNTFYEYINIAKVRLNQGDERFEEYRALLED